MFNEIVSFENLLIANKRASKGKRTKEHVITFNNNLEDELLRLKDELILGTYTPLPYNRFYIFEPKLRLISAPMFRDRNVHHAICNILTPIIDKRFIYDSYACRQGKGTHKAVDRAQEMMRKVNIQSNGSGVYCLKLDVKSYFANVNHTILKRILKFHIKDSMVINLLFKIIDSYKEGLPLGNLTSQLFANMYLNELDREAKYNLKIKYYVRYMDDIVIFSSNKDYLQQVRKSIELFLLTKLKLSTNSKTEVFPVRQRFGKPLDFLGYRLYITHRTLRKSTVKRFKAKVKGLRKSYYNCQINFKDVKAPLASYLGCAKHCDSYNLTKFILSKPFIRKGI